LFGTNLGVSKTLILSRSHRGKSNEEQETCPNRDCQLVRRYLLVFTDVTLVPSRLIVRKMIVSCRSAAPAEAFLGEQQDYKARKTLKSKRRER
jgi:hypothetical protein